MLITTFESLSDLNDFIMNAKDFVCYNCVGRQEEVETKEKNKTALLTEIALYTNAGVLYHTSKNAYKTKDIMPSIAKKETEMLDDKEDLFKGIAEKYHLLENSVMIDKKNNIDIGYTLKDKDKDLKRITA